MIKNRIRYHFAKRTSARKEDGGGGGGGERYPILQRDIITKDIHFSFVKN